MRRLSLILAIVLSLVGCRLPATPGGISPTGATAPASSSEPVPPLEGRADFPAQVRTQATMADAGIGALVSLINTGTNQTVATTLTDTNGRFILTFANGFRPDPSQTYYLEAVKGLNNNTPGNAVARVRTIARFSGSWSSITAGSIVISAATTGLALGAALRNGNPTPFSFESLIGSLVPGTPDVFTPVPGLSVPDCDALTALVNQVLSMNQDPVRSIGLNLTTGWQQLNQTLFVSRFSPESAAVGSAVTVTGTGFSSLPANDVVRFNGQPATTTAAAPAELTVTVPVGASSGPTTLQVGGLVCLGPIFTVAVVLSGMSPTSGGAGTSVTLTGSGFDMSVLAANVVTFGGVSATVTAVSETTLTASVPSSAVSGLVSVTVGDQTVTSSGNFSVPVVVSGFTPPMAPAGTTVTITGSGFSSTLASNSVTFNGVAATVTAALPTSLVVTSPTATTGPLRVTVVGQIGTSAGNYTYGPLPGPGNISTYAGSLVPQAGKSALDWGLSADSVAVDGAGNLYIGDAVNSAVWKVSTGGLITCFAGTGIAGYSGDGGLASSARINSPYGVAVDGAGNVYIAEVGNYRVRKVNTSGIISTFAGTGNVGALGDGGLATNATLNQPMGVAADASGNVYISDRGNHRIRKVDTAGFISTVAGNGTSGFSGDGSAATSATLNYARGLSLDSTGSLYIADVGNNRIRKVDTSGIISSVNNSNGFSDPNGVVVDASGNLYIATTGSQQIRKVDTSGVVTTVAGTGTAGYSGDGSAATLAMLHSPGAVALDASGNLYVADTVNKRLRKVNTGGIISTVAGNGTGASGDGGAPAFAQLKDPDGLGLDASGNLYLCDTNNHRIRKVTPGGVITTVAGSGAQGFSGDGGLATSARFSVPMGVAADGAGNLYIAEWSNSCIRKVTPGGVITTFAGTGQVAGFTGDGGPATSAQLNSPTSVAVDATGSLYIVDYGNNRVRKVTPGGVITTVAGNGTPGLSGDGGPATNAMLQYPNSVVVDGAGNLYISDTSNCRIRKVDTSGVITTFAGTTAGYSGDGGPATSAMLNSPRGLALDVMGNLYFSDYGNTRIRKVSTSGIISTVAGTGGYGYSGDGGAATSATFGPPYGLAIDANLNLFFADKTFNVIRKVY